jgi:hypothetical protein
MISATEYIATAAPGRADKPADTGGGRVEVRASQIGRENNAPSCNPLTSTAQDCGTIERAESAP